MGGWWGEGVLDEPRPDRNEMRLGFSLQHTQSETKTRNKYTILRMMEREMKEGSRSGRKIIRTGVGGRWGDLNEIVVKVLTFPFKDLDRSMRLQMGRWDCWRREAGGLSAKGKECCSRTITCFVT